MLRPPSRLARPGGARTCTRPPFTVRAAYYPVLCPPSSHVLTKSVHLTCADKAVVVHISAAPLVLTLLAGSEANVGLLLDAVPQLLDAVQPLISAVQGMAVRGVT